MATVGDIEVGLKLTAHAARVTALQLAVSERTVIEQPATTVERAEAYLAFLTGSEG